MGGGSSKSTSNISIVNDSIVEAIVSSAQNISGSLTANQQVTHTGLGIFTGATQNVSVSVYGLQKVVVDDQLISNMTQKIIQNVQANNGTIFGGKANTSVKEDVKNYLKTKISTTFIQNCVASAIANQNITYAGVQIGTLDSQNVNYFQQCMSDSLNKNKIAQGITTDTNQTGSSANTGATFSFGLGSFSYLYYIIAFVFIVFIAIFVWRKFQETSEFEEVIPNYSDVTPNYSEVTPNYSEVESF